MADQDMESRMQGLELGQQQLTTTTRDIQVTLQALMDRMPPVKKEPTDGTADPTLIAPTISTVVPPKPQKLKPSQPAEFDGSRTKGRAFINSCLLYASLCPLEFSTEQQMIHWALTFMKKDRAALFAQRTMRIETRTGQPRFATWKEFVETFVSLFCPANEATHALVRLETVEYHQRKRDVDEYIDEFQDLIDLSGYTDPLGIVIKFRRGLSPAIRVKIAELGINRPADNDPEKWFEMARMLDLNRISSEAFEGSYNKPHTTPIATNQSRGVFSRALAPQTSQPTSSISQSRVVPTTRQDIGAQRAPSTPRACFRCGGLDHLSPQCKLKFDVRAMTSDEKDDLLEQLLADKDVATEAVEEVRSCVEEGEVATDFVQCSR
jgi:hypothetical protein